MEQKQNSLDEPRLNKGNSDGTGGDHFCVVHTINIEFLPLTSKNEQKKH